MRQVLVTWRLISHKRFVRGLICMRVRVKLLMEVARQHQRLLATLLPPPRRRGHRLLCSSHSSLTRRKKNHKDKKNNATPVLLLLLHLLSTPPKVVVATPRFCCRTSGWGFMYQSAVLLKCRGCRVSHCQRQRRGRGGGGSGDGNVCQEASQD